MKNVTIIIPVYRDWKTLNLSIESLKKYLSKEHTVMLINDVSDEADEIEAKIKHSIKGFKNFKYYRNESNLGFVKTCNRGVYELDKTNNDILLLNSDTRVTEGFLEEMIEILNLSDRHGIVCPRSNNATLLSMPLKYYGEREFIFDKSFALHNYVKKLLPRFQVIPTAIGFCMLIKRTLIDNFGLFDEAYGRGYHEENDFSMRINKYGYSSIMANRSFVFHYESRSFSAEEKTQNNINNEKILEQRYPHYHSIIQRYFNKDLHPVDHFSDVIYPEFYDRKKVLISLYGLQPVYNGTSIAALNFLKNFLNFFADKYDISILIHENSDKFHNISQKYPNVYYPNTIHGNFHIAFTPYQFFNFEHLFILNKLALKIVFRMLDIIALRCFYINNQSPIVYDNFKLATYFADGIISISNFSKNDTINFFSEEIVKEKAEKIKPIHLGVSFFHKMDSFESPFEKYFLVMGNRQYAHKSIIEIFEAIKHFKNKYNFVFLGLDSKFVGNGHSNIKVYDSGNLTDEFVQNLYYYSHGVIFPSQYEGFGIPILEATQIHKPILLFDNEVNKEIVSQILQNRQDKILFFNNFKHIESLVNNMWSMNPEDNLPSVEIRSWEDDAVDVEKFLTNVLFKDEDLRALELRWMVVNALEEVEKTGKYGLNAREHIDSLRIRELIRLAIRKFIKGGNVLSKPANLVYKIIRK